MVDIYIYIYILNNCLAEAHALIIGGKLQLHRNDHHSRRRHHHEHSSDLKLFVFGDSYADTGNCRNSVPEPYGITFPGKPAGRFSDGRVLTDYIGRSSLQLMKFCI